MVLPTTTTILRTRLEEYEHEGRRGHDFVLVVDVMESFHPAGASDGKLRKRIRVLGSTNLDLIWRV